MHEDATRCTQGSLDSGVQCHGEGGDKRGEAGRLELGVGSRLGCGGESVELWFLRAKMRPGRGKAPTKSLPGLRSSPLLRSQGVGIFNSFSSALLFTGMQVKC